MTNFRIGIQVILTHNRSILLGLRQNGYGHATWGLPGGHLEFGESFEHAAIREVYEETGLSIADPRIFGVANDPSLPSSHHIQIGLIAHEWHGTLELREPERCAQWQFFAPGMLPTPLFASSAPLIEQYLRGTGWLHSWLARWLRPMRRPRHASLEQPVLEP